MAACPVGRVPPDMRKDGYFMKSMKRRLLSLFMAMVMVCSLVPGALAAGTTTNSNEIKFKSGQTTTLNLGGTANLEAEIKSKTVAVTDVTLSPATLSLTLKENETVTGTLSATVVPNNASNKNVSWSSSDASVASVQEGTVTAHKAGTATITVTTEDGNKTATCNVTVTAPATTPDPGGDGDNTGNPGGDSGNTGNPGGDGGNSGTPENPSNPTTPSTPKTTTSLSALSNSSAPTITFTSDNTNVITISGNQMTAVGVGSANITASAAGADSATIKVTVANPIAISRVSGTGNLNLGESTTLKATLSFAAGITPSAVTWASDNSNIAAVNQNGVVTAYGTGSTKIKASVTYNTKTYYDEYTIKVSSQYAVSASVYVESSGYSLGDEDDKGKDSIIEQIDAKLGTKYCTYVWFDTTSHSKGDLDAYKAGSSHTTNNRYDVDEAADVVFTPDSSAKVGDVATFTLTVEDNSRNVYTFDVSFTLIEGTSAGDITYSAALGEDVYFDVSDFEDFYNDKYSSGYLEYVTFGSSSSNGTLYNEDGKTAGSSNYYVDPSKSSQKSLDGIYFSPKSSMKRSTTVKISFTAHGTKRNDTGTGEVSGTVTIFYLNDSASDIVYNTTAGKVTLDPKDFNEAYKQATGSKTAPSNLTIEFQNVPSNGTLTYTGGSKDKDLTKSNVKSNRYTTKSSGTYRLAQLTYTGTRGKDTIDYIAYSGGTAQFSGKVVFNGTAAVPTDVVVTYGSTGGQAVRFSQNDFVSANSAMSKATKVRFVAPANGTLLMNGASASGVDIATTLLGTVTYQPKSGFNGQDKIIFAAYDASNNTVASGTVNITVIGNPTTGTTPGGTPGGVSDVSQFKDVSATAWYRDNLATLVRKGIITGKGDGKFDPLGTVTYGEALKMVLESCGYTAALGTGSQWAINYKNLAVSRGWISSDIDLNAAISRNATAELTAKVLGVSAVTSGSPFADVANGYAAALYYTSPQIFAGSPNPNGGKPLFKNSSPLLRQEVCAVICRVSDYHTQHTTNNMPDGI